jgi:hypothetical protein
VGDSAGARQRGLLVQGLAHSLHMVRQRPAIGMQVHARQRLQRVHVVGREFVGAQQCKPVTAPAAWASASGARTQGTIDLVLQRHQVGRRFAVDHHQVAGNATPGPQLQRLRQRPQQAQPCMAPAVTSSRGRSPGDAEAPEQPPVARRRRSGGAPRCGAAPGY